MSRGAARRFPPPRTKRKNAERNTRGREGAHVGSARERGRGPIAFFGTPRVSGIGHVPRREELHERGLAGFQHFGVEVLGGEVDGAGLRAEHQTHEGDGDEVNLHDSQRPVVAGTRGTLTFGTEVSRPGSRGARRDAAGGRVVYDAMSEDVRRFDSGLARSRGTRPRPTLGGDPEDRRHRRKNGKRRSPDPELARARARDRRYRAGTRLADSKRNGKGVDGRTGRNESCGGLQDVPSREGRGIFFGCSLFDSARLLRCSRRSDWANTYSHILGAHVETLKESLLLD